MCIHIYIYIYILHTYICIIVACVDLSLSIYIYMTLLFTHVLRSRGSRGPVEDHPGGHAEPGRCFFCLS